MFSREWAMPNHATFSIKPIHAMIRTALSEYTGKWIDPFARNSVFNSQIFASNDLSPDCETTHHMESLDFLRTFDDASVDGVLFDPPYSPRQIAECYKSVGRAVHMKDTQSSFYGDRKKEIARIVKPGGIVICCGWNSGGIGKTLSFELQEILLVPHGGAHNDTIVTQEIKQ